MGTQHEQRIAIDELNEAKIHKTANAGKLAAWSLFTSALAGTALIVSTRAKHHDSATIPEIKPTPPTSMKLVDINGDPIAQGQTSSAIKLSVQGIAQPKALSPFTIMAT